MAKDLSKCLDECLDKLYLEMSKDLMAGLASLREYIVTNHNQDEETANQLAFMTCISVYQRLLCSAVVSAHVSCDLSEKIKSDVWTLVGDTEPYCRKLIEESKHLKRTLDALGKLSRVANDTKPTQH